MKYWSKSERDNHASSQRTSLVCKTCRAEGFHPEDLETYTCQQCAGRFGAHRFGKDSLKDWKYHLRQKLICQVCVAQSEERVRMLRQRLQKSKRKCTCQCPIHREKCPLTPVLFGEKRWPGSDGAVSAEDRQFLDSLHPAPDFWAKAWGRRRDS